MNAPILVARGLSKTYATAAGPLQVLHEVSFELQPGASLAILGPSGSGKTTLLGLCAGLDRPSTGEVHLAGRCLAALDEDEVAALRNRAVGFVFQNFQLLPTLTALENVTVPLELRGDRGARARGVELLEHVGLGNHLDHYPVQLSGGEQQRVAIVRAFINEPQVLFADEPMGNLDGATADRVRELLFDLNAARGGSLVLVTHDEQLAARAGRILRLRGGRIVGGGGRIVGGGASP